MQKNYVFSSVAKEWLCFYEGKIKGSTFEMYSSIVHQINISIGSLNIKDVDINILQKHLNTLHSLRYSKSIIQKNKITLNLIFKYYFKNDIQKNPCINLYIPKGASVSKRLGLSDNQIQNIINNYNSPQYLYPIFLLTLGIRRSEALALTWEDIDAENNFVYINKTIEYVKNKPVLWNELKNGETMKIIPILKIVSPLFYELKKNNPKGVVFTIDGTHMLESQNRRLWENFKKLSNMNVTQHQFRHSYATLLYKSGVDLKTAMELLGHKDIKMLLEIYTHADCNSLKKAVNILNGYIESNFHK